MVDEREEDVNPSRGRPVPEAFELPFSILRAKVLDGADRVHQIHRFGESAVVPMLRRLPGHAERRERGYRWVADNRDLFGKVLSREPPARRS